jgi:hypothetical protein
MADEHYTPAAGLPSEEEKNDVGGDIEQGRNTYISENTDCHQRSSSSLATTAPSTTTRLWPLGDLEHVDEEDIVAPVPLIQQIADMGIEKESNMNAKINDNVAPSEDASMQPPAQDAMEQIEDGDDAAPRPYAFVEFDDDPKLKEASQINASINNTEITPSGHASMTQQPPALNAMEQIEDGDDAAPRPFNSAEFEDEPKPKIDLGELSTDEGDDDGPPLTFSQQRDSLSDAIKKSATSKISSSSNSQNEASASSIDGNESIDGGPVVQQRMEERQYPGNEEETRQRVAVPENHSFARQVVSAGERTPSVHILDAYLVEEDEEGIGDVVVILYMKQLLSSLNFNGGNKGESNCSWR